MDQTALFGLGERGSSGGAGSAEGPNASRESLSRSRPGTNARRLWQRYQPKGVRKATSIFHKRRPRRFVRARPESDLGPSRRVDVQLGSSGNLHVGGDGDEFIMEDSPDLDHVDELQDERGFGGERIDYGQSQSAEEGYPSSSVAPMVGHEAGPPGPDHKREMEALLQEACQKLRDQSSLQSRIHQLQDIRMQRLEGALENVIQVVQGMVRGSNDSTSTQTHFNSSKLRPTQHRKKRDRQFECAAQPMRVGTLGRTIRNGAANLESGHNGVDGTGDRSQFIRAGIPHRSTNADPTHNVERGRKRGYGSRVQEVQSMDGLGADMLRNRPDLSVTEQNENFDCNGEVNHEASGTLYDCSSNQRVEATRNIHEKEDRPNILENTSGYSNEPPSTNHSSFVPETSAAASEEFTGQSAHRVLPTTECGKDSESSKMPNVPENGGEFSLSGSSRRDVAEVDHQIGSVKEEPLESNLCSSVGGRTHSSTSVNGTEGASSIIPGREMVTQDSPAGTVIHETRSMQPHPSRSAASGAHDQPHPMMYAMGPESGSMRSLQEIFTSVTGSNVEELFGNGGGRPQEESGSFAEDVSFQESQGDYMLHQEKNAACTGMEGNLHQPSTSSGVPIQFPQQYVGMITHGMGTMLMNRPLEAMDVPTEGNLMRHRVREEYAPHFSPSWSLHLTLPEDYNIRDILEKHVKGGPVLEELDKEKMPSIKNRRLLIQILVSFLIDNGGRNLYPTADQKKALAQAVVSQFPCMRDNLPGAEGYEYLYHKGQGFVEYRLKTLRASVAGHKKCASSSGAPKRQQDHDQNHCEEEEVIEIEVPPQEILDKIEWLKCHPPTEENRAQIYNFFAATHKHRLSRINKEHLTITDVIQQYPLIKDMPGLIDFDFYLEYEDKADAFLSTWHASYFNQIMTLGENYEDGSLKSILDDFRADGDMDLCALYLLTNLLPSSNGHACRKNKKAWKKCASTRSEAVRHVFQHQPLGTDVAEYARSKPAELTQPFLLFLGPSAVAPREYFLVVDHHALPAGDHTAAAFDRLFKAHFAFDVPFDPCVHSFFAFFAAVVYQCSPEEMTPQLRAFHLLLNSSYGDRE